MRAGGSPTVDNTNRCNRQTVVVSSGCLKASAQIGQLRTLLVGRLSQSLLIFLMQLAHQQQLRVQLIQLQMTQRCWQMTQCH